MSIATMNVAPNTAMAIRKSRAGPSRTTRTGIESLVWSPAVRPENARCLPMPPMVSTAGGIEQVARTVDFLAHRAADRRDTSTSTPTVVWSLPRPEAGPPRCGFHVVRVPWDG